MCFRLRKNQGESEAAVCEGDAAERGALRLRGRHGHWVERKVVRQWCVDTRQNEGGELN